MNKKEKKIGKILLESLFFGLFFLSCFFSTFTLDFKLDYFSFETVNYLQNNYESKDFNNTILEAFVEQSDADDLHQMYVDNHYNKFADDCRIITNNEYEIMKFDNLERNKISHKSIRMVYQNYLSCYEYNLGQEQGLCVLDYSKYFLYFNKNVNIGNSDMFIIIADDFANYLLEILYDYNFPQDTTTIEKKEIYSKYLLNKEIILSNNLSYRIVNVFAINEGSGIKLQNRYKNNFFGISYFKAQLKYWDSTPLHFEIDLKINPYGNKNIMLSLIEKYHSIEKFGVKQYNTFDNEYIENLILTEKINKISKESYNPAFSVLPFCLSVLSLFLAIAGSVFFHKDSITKYSLFACLFIFLMYGLLSNFIYIYSNFTLFLAVCLISVILLERKGVMGNVIRFNQAIDSKISFIKAVFQKVDI